MAEHFLMPKLSPTMEEGQISRWLKNEGDAIKNGETIAEVDTDKATMEMTSLKDAVLLKILRQAGDSVPLGDPIAIIGKEGEDFSALLNGSQSSAPHTNGASNVESKPDTEKDEQQSEEANAKSADEKPIVNEKTASSATAAKPSETADHTQNSAQNSSETASGRMIVSPIAARMAAENGVDLKTLKGSGPNGRIIKRDIETALQNSSAQTLEDSAPAETSNVGSMVSASSISEIAGSSRYRDENTTKMRQVIATRLAQSIGPIPTFYLTVEIEMDKALEFRKTINGALKEDEKVSVNDVIVKVAAQALLKHPFVNSSYQDKTIRFYEDADIGVAVAVEDGLITPVVRGANRKGISEISKEIKEMAGRAREKKLQPEEYTGATFSISNLGMFGIEQFTAIINPPEAAILAIGGATPKAVVRDGEIVVRNIMNVTMSCDHRVIDGATGAKFLQTFKQMLENPILMMM